MCRDATGEAIVCLWNNHSNIITDECVGRPVLFAGVTVGELDGAPILKLPKASSISIGDRPETRAVKDWWNLQGHDIIDVGQAEQGFTGPQIVSVKGMLAKIVDQNITTQNGASRNLVTLHITGGPPTASITVQFWNSTDGQAKRFEAFLHQSVVIRKMRAYIDVMRGSTFESIGQVTSITKVEDQVLMKWWFTPRPVSST